MRKFSAIISFSVLAALLAAACTPGGPAPLQWKVSPQSITVNNTEDYDAGDEPYVMQLGFRSKIGVPESSVVTFASQCYANKIPANNAGANGVTLQIPAGSADILLPNVQNLDIGDLAQNNAPFEIIGSMTFVAESDRAAFFSSCALSDALRSLLAPVLQDALDLLIAASPVPPTQDQLIALIVDNLGNFINGLGGIIASFIEGLGNPDDIIGVAVQIHLPTAGVLTDLIRAGLALGGLFAPGLEQGFIPVDGLPSTFAIKLGSLTPSTSTFRFASPAADYTYVSKISLG